MCGIAGIIGAPVVPDNRRAELRRMCDVIRHRGPDDEGFFVSADGRVGLGMRRLSIIDLEGGRQPFYSEDGRVVSVVNGEIYNFKPLRRELEGKGHLFRSRSDSETVVHAYEEYGDAFVEHLEGMFGLALYDVRRQRLMLVRDRLGIKPLYYTQTAGGVVFGSEIKSILADESFPRRLNGRALPHYLWNVSVPDPWTLFEGIYKLPPGHRLSVDLDADVPKVGAGCHDGAPGRCRVPVRHPGWPRDGTRGLLPGGTPEVGAGCHDGAQTGHPQPTGGGEWSATVQLCRYWRLAVGAGQCRRVGVSECRSEGAGGDLGHPDTPIPRHPDTAAGGCRRTGVSACRGGQCREPAVTTHDPSEATPEAMLRELRRSIELHLQSDVPVGILLSGGVDSSAVTALASELYPDKLHTFSIAFDVPGYSEFEYSSAVARQYGTEHHPITIGPLEYWDLAQRAVWHMDEPVCDLAMPAMLRICEYARDHVKVLLSGEGADELLGGYARRLQGAAALMSPLGRLRHLIRNGQGNKLSRIRQALCALPEALCMPDPVWMLRAERLGWHERDIASLPASVQVQRSRLNVPGSTFRAGIATTHDSRPTTHGGYQPPWRDWIEDPALRDRWECPADDLLDRLLYLDTNVNLPATLLMKADKMSMAASIELRVPFLGDEFVRYAVGLPLSAKVQGMEGKVLLKRAMEPYLPHDLLYRRKQGWPVPIGDWIRDPLKAQAEHCLFDAADGIVTWFSESALRRYWDAHQGGDAKLGGPLWQLVLLSLWRKRFRVET